MRVGWERADLCLPSCTSIFTPPTVPEKASPRPRESTNQGSPTNLKSFQPKSHLEPLPLAVVGQRACPSHVPCSPFHSVLLPVYLITSLVWAPIPTLLLSEGISDHLGWGGHKQLPLPTSLSFWLDSPFISGSSMSEESCENCFSYKSYPGSSSCLSQCTFHKLPHGNLVSSEEFMSKTKYLRSLSQLKIKALQFLQFPFLPWLLGGSADEQWDLHLGPG